MMMCNVMGPTSFVLCPAPVVSRWPASTRVERDLVELLKRSRVVGGRTEKRQNPRRMSGVVLFQRKRTISGPLVVKS